MKQKMKSRKEKFPVTRQDVKPAMLALIAAGALQDREPKRRERWAMGRIGEMARRSFVAESISPERLDMARKLYHQTAYWHGTGRYQRHAGQEVDVLQTIIRDRAINPSLDPYEPKLGLIKTVSLASLRLYARAYADMHSDQPNQLNRFIRAQDVANFYVVRTAARHAFREARSHPDGFRAGLRALRDAARERHSVMPQTWQAKVTGKQVNTMFAFTTGSDIPGNYPILFGIDDSISPIETHTGLRETREVRVGEPITLDRVTHVEVPRERVDEVAGLFSVHELEVPVFAIEDMEQYVARQPITETLLRN
jgi:hypothetical protein